jgi:hypothetical protein
VRCLLEGWAGLLLHIGVCSRLLWPLHLKLQSLHLEIGLRHFEVLPLQWHRAVGRYGVLERMSMEGHLPLSILFHLLEFILNDDAFEGRARTREREREREVRDVVVWCELGWSGYFYSSREGAVGAHAMVSSSRRSKRHNG